MKAYLQMIIWMMLFVIVIEMIFPDAAYRKYIKLILGCILVYTLMSPIIRFLNLNEAYSFDDYVAKYQQKFSGEEAEYHQEVEKQLDSLKEVYKEGIKQLVEQNFDVKVLDVAVTYHQEAIENIDLTVGDKESSQWAISPIQIGEKSDTVDGDEEKLKNRIKTCLNNFYNVQDRNIHITVQKN